MKIYEGKESLESMILGINQDPKRVMFDEMIQLLKDIKIEREFVEVGVVPRFEISGTMHELGYYPNDVELAALLNVDPEIFSSIEHRSELLDSAQHTRLGACCGVGMDVYLDPNED